LLTDSTPIGKLDDVVVTVGDDFVQLMWGGALVGHWGFTIQDKPLPPNPRHFARRDVAPDIVLWIIPD
jgi:hypothetical protein